MAKEIYPGSPEFDEVASRVLRVLDDLDEAEEARLLSSEESFRAFIAYAAKIIADRLNYTIGSVVEFVEDIKWSARQGWREGRERARRNRLRP